MEYQPFNAVARSTDKLTFNEEQLPTEIKSLIQQAQIVAARYENDEITFVNTLTYSLMRKAELNKKERSLDRLLHGTYQFGRLVAMASHQLGSRILIDEVPSYFGRLSSIPHEIGNGEYTSSLTFQIGNVLETRLPAEVTANIGYLVEVNNQFQNGLANGLVENLSPSIDLS